ncbi:hypothetical protein V7094_25570 [Priestia megaterium]|uniref:hypothetical protein n=1 Tax=Priestia megaterium TaxID=1404 RepID=UPI0030004CE8
MNKRIKKKLAKKIPAIPKGYGKIVSSHYSEGIDYHNFKIGDIVKVVEITNHDIICERESDGLEQILLPHHIELG